MSSEPFEWVTPSPGPPGRPCGSGSAIRPKGRSHDDHEPIELDALPSEGETINVTATGDLTFYGVTRAVQVPLQAQLSRGTVCYPLAP